MPDKDKSKVPTKSTARLVKEIPEGYTKEVVNGRTEYVKRSEKPKSDKPGGNRPTVPNKSVNAGSVKPKVPRRTPPTKKPGSEAEDRLYLEEPKEEIKPTKHEISGGANILRRAVPEMSSSNYTAYQYPDETGNYTNKATTRYFDKTGGEVDTNKSFDTKGNFVPSYIQGSNINQGANIGGLTTIDAVGANMVDKPVVNYSGNQTNQYANITKNAQGGAGITNYAGATKTFVAPKYDALGNKIPSAETGIIYDQGIKNKVNAVGGNAGTFKLANQVSPEDIKPKPTLNPPPRFNKGGIVGKINGYYQGGTTGFNESLNEDSGLNEGVVGQNDPYAEQIARDKEERKKKRQDNIKKTANAGGEALGGYGSAYYNSQTPTSEGDATRSGAMAAVSKSGPIGGAIGGIAAIGDKIGKPIKARSESMSSTGELNNESQARRNAIGGGLFSPSKALAARSSYVGGYTDVSGKGYTNSLEEKAKNQLQEVKSANFKSTQQQALANRNNNDLSATTKNPYDLTNASFDTNQNLTLVNNQQFDKNRPMMNKGGLVGKMKMNREMKRHHEQMCADGGEIKGKGGPKEDKIEAEVEEGSFVVPAKNNELAKGIRELYLKVPKSKKANLHQKEGEEVKLSNGEHLFTPEENEYLESIGVDLEALAPEAENGEDEMAKGGLTAHKARMILHDKKVHGKPLTDQQRKFFGAISNGESIAMACGGKVKGYAKGGDVDGDPLLVSKADINKSFEAKKSKDIADRKVLKEKIKQAESNPNTSKLFLQTLKDKVKSIDEAYGVENNAVEAKKPSTAKVSVKVPTSKKQAIVKEAPEQMAQRGSALEGLRQDAEIKTNTPTEVKATINPEKESIAIAKTPSAKKGWAERIGNIDPTAFVGIGQTALGLNMLKGEKRPIDRAVIDPAYNANVERSMRDAQFGLTPEQRVGAEQDIQNSLNDAKFQGLNYAGGSGVQAFNTNRAAINDAWKAKLGLKEADTNLRMQKQQYADAQVANRANTLAGNRRMLFNDAMNTFQQKQGAGSELIGEGLKNQIGAYRFQQDQKARAEAEAQRNAWTQK